MVDPYDSAGGDGDAQDVAEVFDEDNTNIESMRQSRGEDAEQFEDLVDVYDTTRADGDDSDDDDDDYDADDLDDEDLKSEDLDEDEDDDGVDRDPRDREPRPEDDTPDDDDIDGLEAADPDEVELEYVGDLTDVADARSSAADMESASLSDEDLRDLHYKEDAS
ncbi:MAG: hypothetical protein WA840_20800 [Caulobacteraceae bacterium]